MSKEPENVQHRHLYKAVFVKQLQKHLQNNTYTIFTKQGSNQIN